MPKQRLSFLAGAALALALPFLWVHAEDAPTGKASRHSCPEPLLGVWRTELPAGDLLAVDLSITETSPGSFEARVAGSDGADRGIAVSQHGELLRFQSAKYPVAFEGKLSPDGRALEGFVYSGSAVAHTRLPLVDAGGERQWARTWSLLGVPAESFPFDLYVGREDDGNTYGYFFFRDQRLPSLYGYGMACDGDGIVVGEKNLNLWFEGRFDAEADVLDLTVTGLGGAVPVQFHRLQEEQVPESPWDTDVAPRPAADAGYGEHAPPRLDDGWDTATPSAEGIDPAIIGDLVDAIVSQEMAKAVSSTPQITTMTREART